jgi:GrpB-like predicted nucleotidyltransferase (UPF0157 family)
LDKSLEQRIEEAVREEVAIVPYDPEWPRLFEIEAEFLRGKLAGSVVLRIEHFGSTAIWGTASKPIIDLLVEVSSLEEAREQVVPVLEVAGYDYFWRPVSGDDGDFYHWFIRRNKDGVRTHHIHMVEADSKLWDGLYFRDYMREFPEEAERYGELKMELSEKYPKDRVAYHEGKSEYVVRVTEKAREYYKQSRECK